MAEGNKQAKILESEAENQLLINLKYLEAATINVVEGNKQAKIPESEAEKQQLNISIIYRQPPSMWWLETSRPRSWSLRQRS